MEAPVNRILRIFIRWLNARTESRENWLPDLTGQGGWGLRSACFALASLAFSFAYINRASVKSATLRTKPNNSSYVVSKQMTKIHLDEWTRRSTPQPRSQDLFRNEAEYTHHFKYPFMVASHQDPPMYNIYSFMYQFVRSFIYTISLFFTPLL